MQFLTFNMDENPGLTEPFLKEHKLAFTVLPAHAYIRDTLKVNGIPENWILDSNCLVCLKGIGYDST